MQSDFSLYLKVCIQTYDIYGMGNWRKIMGMLRELNDLKLDYFKQSLCYRLSDSEWLLNNINAPRFYIFKLLWFYFKISRI